MLTAYVFQLITARYSVSLRVTAYRYALQRIATHCNVLLRVAAYCCTLQHVATRSFTVITTVFATIFSHVLILQDLIRIATEN